MPETSLPSGIEAKRLSVAASIVCLIVFTLAIVPNAMDRLIFPLLLTYISKSYGFGLKQAGFLSTVFTLGMGCAGVLSAWLLGHWSRRAVLVWGMLIYSFFTLTTVLAFGFVDLAIYRALTGLGEVMQMSALFAAAGSYFYKNKGVAIGTIIVGFGFGGLIGPAIGMKVMLATKDWHSPFYVFAGIGFILAAIVWFGVPRSFSEAVPETSGARQAADVSNIPEHFWTRNVKLCYFSAVIWGVTALAFFGLYPTFLIQKLHFPPMTAGYAMSMFGAGCMLGLVGGWLGDRISQRWIAIASWVGSILTCYCIYNVATQTWSQNVLAFLMGLFSSSLFVPNLVSLSQRSVRPLFVGKASSLYMTFAYLSSTVAGYLFAWLVGLVGWGGAGLIQLSLIPIAGIVSLVMINNGALFQPKAVKKAAASA